MNNKGLFFLIAAVILSPVCCMSTYIVDESNVNNNFAKFMLFIFVWGGFILLLRWLGRILWDNYHAPKAAMNLAGDMGLTPLTQESDPKYAYYGGSFQGIPFAITPVRYMFRYNLDGESRVRFEVFLRIIIPINKETLSGIVVRRAPRVWKKANHFEIAFPRIKNAETLTDKTKEAMLDFIKKGYGSKRKFSFFSAPNLRNLSLLDRHYVGERRLDKEVFSETAVFLIHDHPNPLSITRDHLETILSEMNQVAKIAER